MITVTVLKGAFQCEVIGSRVHITCLKKSCRGKAAQDLDDSGFLKDHPASSEPAKAAFSAQDSALSKAKRVGPGPKKELEAAQREGNLLRGQLLTPCACDGRPSGYRRVICPYCMQAGVIGFTSTRQTPSAAIGLITREDLNRDGVTHTQLRARVTFIMLRSIDYLAQTNTIAKTAHVVCPGASLQMTNQKDRGYEDAHQVLRELTVGGKYLYKYEVSPLREAMAYCLSVVSHLPEEWNEVDCLIEGAITIPMILLGQCCVNGAFRKQAADDRGFCKLLWKVLTQAYHDAIAAAPKDADDKYHDILEVYRATARSLTTEDAPPFVYYNPVKLWKSCLGGAQ